MPTPEEIQKARDEFAAAAAAPVKTTSLEPTALSQVSAEEIQKARDEFAAALQPKPAGEVITKGPVTSPEPGFQVIAKPTEPPVVVPDEYAPKPKEEAVPAETPQTPLIPEAIPPEEEQRRVPIEAAGGGGGGGGGGYGEPTDTEKGTFGKDMVEILTKPGRGGVLGTIDTATEAGSRLFAEAAPEAATAVGAVHGFTPELTAEDKAKVKTDVGLSLTTFGRGWLEGRSFGLYVPPELTPEQKALGGDYAQQVGSLIGIGGAIKSIAAAVPTGLEMLGIKKVVPALTGEFAKFAAGEAAVTGFLYSIFDYAGRNTGAWAAGTTTEPGFSQGMISQGLQQGAAYLGMPEVAKAIHDGTKALGPAAMALDFMGFTLGGLGATKVMTSLIESIQGRMAGRAVEPWLPQTEREVKDIKWDTKDPGEAFDILNRSSDITMANSPDAYAAYQKAQNYAIKTNPAFRQAALYREMGDEFRPIGPDGKKGDYPSFDELQQMVEEKQAALRTAKQEAGKAARDNATPMGTGADEATATGKVSEEAAPAPVAEVKVTPVGTGSDEVAAIAKAPPVPEEGAPGPVAEAKPTPIETIGTGDAVIKSDQVAADTQAAKTAAEAKAAPAPVPNQPEIAPETMAQSSAPANVEPVKAKEPWEMTKGEWVTPKAKPPNTDLKGEGGYVYHATNEDNAFDISQGKVDTHKPGDFTDQNTWPDGGTEKRSYWSDNAGVVWQFAPEHGSPVILRTKRTADFKNEWEGGDVYTKQRVGGDKVEILGDDGKWHPLKDFMREHKDIISDALAQGLPVPPEVLADYPDLAAKAAAIPGRNTFTQTQPPILEQTENGVQERPLVQHSLKQARELAPVYYSQMSKFMDDKLPGQGTGENLSKLVEGWAGLKEVGRNKNDVPIFSKAEFKQDELKWSGLVPWLREQKGPVTKQQILDKLKEGEVQVKVVEKTTEPKPLEWRNKGDFWYGRDIFRDDYQIEKTHDGWFVLNTPSERTERFRVLHDAKNRAEEYNGQNNNQGTTKFQSYLTDLPEPFTNRREMLLTVPPEVKDVPSNWTTKINPEETKYAGHEVRDIIDATGRVRATLPAEDVAEYLRHEAGTERGGAAPTYQVPGPHAYGDTAADVNRFAHLFTADYVDPKTGEKYLVVTETQSDWAREGRSRGYAGEEHKEKIAELKKQMDPFVKDEEYIRKEKIAPMMMAGKSLNEIATSPWHKGYVETVNIIEDYKSKISRLETGVPPLPFAKNWHEVALKQAIRYAAENGYDGVMVVNGDMVKQRYDLSRQVDSIEVIKRPDDSGWTVRGVKDGTSVGGQDVKSLDKLDEVIGKEPAAKVREKMAGLKNEYDPVKLEGLDLQVGGEWANNLYDKTIPSYLKKYVKQWGAEVGKKEVPSGPVKPGTEEPFVWTDSDGVTHYSRTEPLTHFDITPEMKESVLYNGQPQFRLKEAENVQKEAGPATVSHGKEARGLYRRHLPQDGEGSERELAAFQRLYQGAGGGDTSAWPTLRYDEELAVTPEFQRAVTNAKAEGIDLVIPVRGGNFNAQLITGRDGKTTILIDSGHDREHTAEQFGDHEVGHHLINNNDPRMVALMKRVDTQSTAFKLYREWHNAASDAVGQGHLSKNGVVQELACDYRAGIHAVEIGGSRVNFSSAFRPEGQAAPGFMRTLFGRPAAAAASPRAPPPGGGSIIPGVRSRLKKAPKSPENVLIDKYKLAKVANVGGKNWAKEQARRLEVKHMDMIREAVGEKKVGPKTIEMSKVLTNFIDHFREPEHLAKFYHDQPAEVQGWLDKFAQVSDDPDLMTIVGKLKGASEALATEAYDEEVIREAFENHQNRIYKEEKRPGHMAGAKFATATGHSQKRFYMTRLEARAPIEKGGGGKTFKVENVAENLRVLTEEIKNVIENRRMVSRGLKEGWLSTDQHEGWKAAPWPQMYKRTWQFKAEPEAIILEMQRLSTEVKNSSTTSTTTKGGPAPGAGATGGSESGPVQKMIDVITNSLEVRGVTPEEAKTYVRRVQEAAVRAAKGAPETPPAEGTPAPETITTIIKEVRETLTTLEKQQKVVGHRFDEIRRKNMYMDNDGNVFAKVPLYAPPEVAKDLHRLFETQELSPTMEKVVQYNAMAKASTLAFSGFHLFSYGRNLLTIPGFWQAVHPIGYYKKGRALAEAEHPDTEGLIRNGYITFSGKPPDWSELAEDQRTALGDLMGKNALTRKTRDAFWNLIDFNAKLIFEKVGNSYKLQFAHDILNHLRNKYPHLTDEQAYYYAADHANDVFGGRNEEIAGTLFGDRLASSAKARLWSRLFILARDWTMSNLRLFMKAFQRGPSGHLARQYWGYAMAKTFAAVIAINLLVSMIDDRSAWQSFKDAFHDPKQLRWLDVNVTPFYKLAATLAGYTPTEARKYLRVGGHFYDAFKMLINPVQFFHHKQSVLARFFWEGLSGQDWRGNVFTTLNELTGVTESVMGPLTGQLTKEGKSTGAIGYGQMPSFLLHQARGVIPIPMQNMLYAMMGEMDGFTAAIKSAGGLASSANVKTEAQDLMTEYYQNVTPTTKSPEQKARTELKKELLQVYRSGDLDTFKDRLEEAVTNKVVSHQEAQQWADEAPLPPGVQSFVKLPMEMAMKVLAAGTEEEKNLWMPYLLRKIGQSKPDTILKHQEALVKLLDKEGAGDTASIIESLTDPTAVKQLKFTAPDIAEMHRIDMLESWGVVDTYVASLLRQQMAPKPPPRPTLSANPLRGGLGKQRSILDKMLGIRS